jgi:hypothetical protein
MPEHNFDHSATQANRDRATRVATAVIQIVVVHLCETIRDKFPLDVRTEIEAALRDEFADVAHQVRGERDPPIDN